jgi:anti-sigma regulatory factor (Ser/Thr protein kinase)
MASSAFWPGTGCFYDDGRTDPALPTTIAEAPDGGFGLMIVRRTASAMRYERTANQRNRLVVTLNPGTGGTGG